MKGGKDDKENRYILQGKHARSKNWNATYGFKKATGKSINEHALSAFTEEMRQCEKTHSSELSEVFFITLDEIDCTTIN